MLETLIREEKFHHHPIRVYEVDGGLHSAIYLEKDMMHQLIFPYMQIAASFLEENQAVYMIGGGMFTFARYIIHHYNHTTIDVSEIDATSLQVAKDYFFFEEDPRISIVFEDGRKDLERRKEKYDIIFSDAFVGLQYAKHLYTQSFAKCILKHLHPHGIYIANIPGKKRLSSSKELLSIIETFKTCFPYVYLLDARGEVFGKEINYVLIASQKELFLPFALEIPKKRVDILKD